MEAYKTTCFDCKRVRYWEGYKTGLGKTPEQLAQMEKEEKTCFYCGSDNVKTELDDESPVGLIYRVQSKLLAKAIVEAFKERK